MNNTKVYVVLCWMLLTASVMRAMELSIDKSTEENSSLQLTLEKESRCIPQTNIFLEFKNQYYSMANNGRYSDGGVTKEQISTFYGGNLLINKKGSFIRAYQIMNNAEQLSRRFSEEESFLVPITLTERQIAVIEDIVDDEDVSDEEFGQENIVVIDNLNNFYRIIGVENYPEDEPSSFCEETNVDVKPQVIADQKSDNIIDNSEAEKDIKEKSKNFVEKSKQLQQLVNGRDQKLKKLYYTIAGVVVIGVSLVLLYAYKPFNYGNNSCAGV